MKKYYICFVLNEHLTSGQIMSRQAQLKATDRTLQVAPRREQPNLSLSQGLPLTHYFCHTFAKVNDFIIIVVFCTWNVPYPATNYTFIQRSIRISASTEEKN